MRLQLIQEQCLLNVSRECSPWCMQLTFQYANSFYKHNHASSGRFVQITLETKSEEVQTKSREVQTKCFPVRKGILGTLSEVAALSSLIKRESIRSLLVVSSGTHLRRSVESLRGYCSDFDVRIVPVAATAEGSLVPSRAQNRESEGLLLAKECVKYACYRLLVLLKSRGD